MKDPAVHMTKYRAVFRRGVGVCLAALCFLLMLLSGCSPFSEDDSKNGTKQLVFTYWGNVDEKRAMERLIGQFEEQNAGVKIKLNHIPSSDDYMTKMAAMLASQMLPDVGYFLESSVLKWAENGRLLDLTELFEDESVISKKLDMLRFVSRDGKTVGASVANEVVLLFYNKTLFDEAQVPYPPASADEAWTWDEFIAAAKKLTRDKQGRTPDDPQFDTANIATYGAFVPATHYFITPLLWSNGGGILDKDHKTILLDKPESIEVLQALQDMIYKHRVSPTPSAQGTIPALSSALQTQKVAMQFDTQYVLMTMSEAKKNEGLDYGVAVLPKFKEPVTVNGGSPIVVFSTTKHPEEAKKLVAFLMNPENSLALINGGLWMPNEEKWYTDQSYIDRWVREDVHTSDYKTAVIDYTMQCARSNLYYTYGNTTELYAQIWPEFDVLFGGNETAQQAVDNIMPGLRKFLEEQEKSEK